MYENFKFTINDTPREQSARLGTIITPHGSINTPAFIFCGTKASVKSISPHQLKAENTQIILSNTYHLFVYPGADFIKKRGGLHKFMGWDGPILTDSGGFQIFSLGHGSVCDEIKGRRNVCSTSPSLIRITDDGAEFRSYWNGDKMFITPEISIDIQHNLGADIILCFDECTPFNVSKEYTTHSMHRSHKWEKRSFDQFQKLDCEKQALYGIVQGGVYPDLRKISSEFVNSLPFFGTAIGGSLGSTKSQMYEVVEMSTSYLTKQRPIHLLGIGGISDIFNGVSAGIDTFDCVHPTRIARHGGALVSMQERDDSGREHINLKNSRYESDDRPIDNLCQCPTCRSFSRAYIHYLLKANEMLAIPAITIHNIHFMNQLMCSIRDAISSGKFEELKKQWCI